MPDINKYVDLNNLRSYHEKSMGVIDKKINWDNLKKKPFGVIPIDASFEGTYNNGDTLDYEGIGFENFKEGCKFSVKLNDDEYTDLDVGYDDSDPEYPTYYVCEYPEGVDSTDIYNDTLFIIYWSANPDDHYATIALPQYDTSGTVEYEVHVTGEYIKKIDEKFIPDIDYSAIKNGPNLSEKVEFLEVKVPSFNYNEDSPDVTVEPSEFSYGGFDTGEDTSGNAVVAYQVSSSDSYVVNSFETFPNEIEANLNGETIQLKKCYHNPHSSGGGEIVVYGNLSYYINDPDPSFNINVDSPDTPFCIEFYREPNFLGAALYATYQSTYLDIDIKFLKTQYIDVAKSIENAKDEIEKKYFTTEYEKYAFPYVDFALMEPKDASDCLVVDYNTLDDLYLEFR